MIVPLVNVGRSWVVRHIQLGNAAYEKHVSTILFVSLWWSKCACVRACVGVCVCVCVCVNMFCHVTSMNCRSLHPKVLSSCTALKTKLFTPTILNACLVSDNPWMYRAWFLLYILPFDYFKSWTSTIHQVITQPQSHRCTQKQTKNTAESDRALPGVLMKTMKSCNWSCISQVRWWIGKGTEAIKGRGRYTPTGRCFQRMVLAFEWFWCCY